MLRDFLFNTVLPSLCVLCHGQTAHAHRAAHTSSALLCAACWHDWATDAHHTPRCAQCGDALPFNSHISNFAAAHCAHCIKNPPAFDATWVALDYAAPFDALIQDFKFSAQLAHATLFADLLAARWHASRCSPAHESDSSNAKPVDNHKNEPHEKGDVVAQTSAPCPKSTRARFSGIADTFPASTLPDVLLPVPLARERLQERGFNQSWEIARRLGKQLQIAHDADWLVKVRNTPAQANLPFAARRKNMHGAFAVMRDLSGLHIGLVDDVMTTGSTLNELAAVCKRHGATRVTCWVAARTVRHP